MPWKYNEKENVYYDGDLIIPGPRIDLSDNKKKKMYLCGYCSDKFENLEELRFHEKRQHDWGNDV